MSYYCDMTLSQEFYPMEAQLSLKAALPLAERLRTAWDRYSKTGPSTTSNKGLIGSEIKHIFTTYCSPSQCCYLRVRASPFVGYHRVYSKAVLGKQQQSHMNSVLLAFCVETSHVTNWSPACRVSNAERRTLHDVIVVDIDSVWAHQLYEHINGFPSDIISRVPSLKRWNYL